MTLDPKRHESHLPTPNPLKNPPSADNDASPIPNLTTVNSDQVFHTLNSDVVVPSPTPGAVSEVRLRKDHRSKEAIEIPQRRRVVAIGDIEANAQAFKGILHGLDLVHVEKNKDGIEEYKGTKRATETTIIQTGDIFDRGDSLFDTLKYIQALQKHGIDIRITAGNHDLMALHAFSCPSVRSGNPLFQELVDSILENTSHDNQVHQKALVENLLKFIFEKGHPFGLVLQADVTAFLNWYFEGGKETLNEIRNRYCSDKSENSLIEPLEQGDRLFFRGGQYSSILDSVSAIEHIEDVTYLHANFTTAWARLLQLLGADRLNEGFRESIKAGDILSFVHGAEKELFWRRGPGIDLETAEILQNMGIKAVVRGHDPQDNHKQHLADYFGIKIISNDVGNGDNNLGAVMVAPSGEVTGYSKSNFAKGRKLFQLPPLQAPGNNNSSPEQIAL